MKQEKKRYQIVVVFIVGILITFACQKDDYITDNSARLEFSTDTVTFDTIFSNVGSITQNFRVYNRHKQPIRISSIELADDTKNYRLNINGIQANSAENITIPAEDSIYIFVEVTVNPTGENNPMVIQDSIVFLTNNNRQDVDLVSYGQDVHLIDGQYINTQTWKADKPYLVYNSMAIDTNQVLTLEPGVHVHFHKDTRMFVFGTLQAEGTPEEPIVFCGDRLEDLYVDLPGQWIGLLFIEGSKNNILKHAEIKNATIGVHCGTLSYDEKPDIELYNCKIEHMSYAGIYSLGCKLSCANVLIGECGTYSIAMVMGGEYEFYHCTIGAYWPYGSRNEPTVAMTNYLLVEIDNELTYFTIDLARAYFGNCIVYGSQPVEVLVSEDEDYLFNYYFDNCILKTDTSIDVEDRTHFADNNIINPYFRFRDIDKYDYVPDTLSVAKDAAKIEIINNAPPEIRDVLQYDLNHKSRMADGKPDIGAYERIE